MARVSDIMLFEHPDQPALVISKDDIPLEGIADFILQSNLKLAKYIAKMGETTSDTPFVIYFEWRKMYTEPTRVDVVYPTAKPLPGSGEIISRTIPSEHLVACVFRGNYAEMQSLYDNMEKWAEDRKLEVSGDCYEFYLNTSVREEEDYLTKVMFPVKKAE